MRDFRSIVFDCDGVVLDSNKVKTEAFYNAALPYGKAAADRLVAYHKVNGGISRYKKFEFFLREMVPGDAEGPGLHQLLANYAAEVRKGLMACRIAPGLQQLRELVPAARWLIVSGGDQAELRDVFRVRGLDVLFDGGIFGSPDTKELILARELSTGKIPLPALFLGDSRYDHEAAAGAGLDFVFIREWTEFADFDAYCGSRGIPVVNRLADFLPGIAAA